MFKSTSFTAAFIALSVTFIGLTILFCYLVFGKGGELLASGQLIAPVSEETTPETDPVTSGPPETTSSSEASESESEASVQDTDRETESESEEKKETAAETEKVSDTSIRPLTAEEAHQYPVIGEVIPETGVITVVKAGDAGEGIVFHALPEFNAASTPGNVVNYGGSYDITGKIYIMHNERPFLMYKTFDNYYCTSSTEYMSYQASVTSIKPDPSKVGSYGLDENEGVLVVVHSDDGNHVVFSVCNYNAASSQSEPVLRNVIAKYNSIGVASFEYHFSDGKTYTGTICFERINDSLGSKIVDLNFPVAMPFSSGERKEVVLHKK